MSKVAHISELINPYTPIRSALVLEEIYSVEHDILAKTDWKELNKARERARQKSTSSAFSYIYCLRQEKDNL